MGHVRHHAIVVTGTRDMPKRAPFNLEEKRNEILQLVGDKLVVTEIYDSPSNMHATFFVCPDGSKQWWPASNHGDKLRGRIISLLEGTGLSWAEVQYGDDDRQDYLLSSSGRPRRES